MINFNIEAVKRNFFDRDKVQKAADRATRKNHSKFGAFVRTRARTSIRKRKGTSMPGRPPYSHVGLVRDKIFFAWDESIKGVVIGPVLLNKPNPRALELLEHGGVGVIRNRFTGQIRSATWRARPFMLPAFREELKRIPAIWRNSIKG